MISTFPMTGRSFRCATCNQVGYCAVDCTIAPWNQDRPYLTGPAAPFRLLLRMRRWMTWPLSYRDVTWMSPLPTSWRWQ